MLAKIYQPAKTAMQSGKAKTTYWLLEFEGTTPRSKDPLMGWTSSSDMLASQTRLKFESKEDAVAYAKEHRIPFQLIEKKPQTRVLKSYSDNFAFRRRMSWTH